MRFAQEGFPFLLTFAAITLLTYMLWGMAALLPLFITLFMGYFFRDPERNIPAQRDVLVAPADGKVIVTDKILEEEFLKEECTMLSIFMSPLNVHVNRAPCDCTVIEVRHKKGRFLSAFKPEASFQNESISLLLNTPYGNILVRQIAGFVARRAVCRVKEGDRLNRGDRFGIIKFSSRVDIFMPVSLALSVRLNDIVKAGETIIAEKKI